MRAPGVATHVLAVRAERDGVVISIDNRNLSRVAKLAGAPRSAISGVFLKVRLADLVAAGDTLAEIHAAMASELSYTAEFLTTIGPVIQIREYLPRPTNDQALNLRQAVPGLSCREGTRTPRARH